MTGVGVPTFGNLPYSPDNSQNARRFMTGLTCDEFGGDVVQIEVAEMSAPSESKGGPAKAVCRVRVSVPQLKLATTAGTVGSSTGLAMTGQQDYIQAVVTLTVPALWGKIILGAVPSTAELRFQTVGLIRMGLCEAVNGVIGDLKPSTAFASTAWTTALPTTSPLYRALQGANPEDVFNGSYGVA
jgi:hypothetical protein